MSFPEVAVALTTGARWIAAGAFVLAATVALTHWGVRKGSIQAFGGWARFVRNMSDPVLRPLERRIARAGANPQDAPAWLAGLALVLGLVLIAVVNWIVGFIAGLIYQSQVGGPHALLVTVVRTVFSLLMLALFIRVIASWFGMGRYNRFIRITYILTDWLVEPIQRVLPPMGMIDFSPLVAYFVLSLGSQLIVKALM